MKENRAEIIFFNLVNGNKMKAEIISTYNIRFHTAKYLKVQITNKKCAEILVDSNPFENCQIFSIKPFQSILLKTITDFQLKNVIKTCIKTCYINKKMLMIDVNETYSEQIERVFKVHSKTPYVNFTGSNMIIYLLNLKNL